MEFTESEIQTKTIETQDNNLDIVDWSYCVYGDTQYQVGSKICIEGRVMECSIEGTWFPTGDAC